jgi:hypothetical protein
LNAPVLVTSPSAPLYIRAPSAARTLTVSVDVRTTTRSGPANSTLPAKTAVPGSPPAEQRLAAGLLWPDTGLFFVRPNGAAWHPNSVTQRFRRLVARAGLPPIRLHDLRHGAATMALDAGVDIKVVQEQLGHSTSTLTRDTYQSVVKQLHYAAADAVAKNITGRQRKSA